MRSPWTVVQPLDPWDTKTRFFVAGGPSFGPPATGVIQGRGEEKKGGAASWLRLLFGGVGKDYSIAMWREAGICFSGVFLGRTMPSTPLVMLALMASMSTFSGRVNAWW